MGLKRLVWRNQAALTNLFGNHRDCVAGQIKDQEVLKAGNKVWHLQQSGPVDVPLLDLIKLDQTVWQNLNGTPKVG